MKEERSARVGESHGETWHVQYVQIYIHMYTL